MNLVNQIVNMDGLAFLREIPDASVDLVLTDPPYSVLTPEYIEDVKKECHRVLKEGGYFALSSDEPPLTALVNSALDEFKINVEPVLTEIIEKHTKPGDIVLDPFLGNGHAVIVAKKLGRQYIGADISPIACDFIKSQL